VRHWGSRAKIDPVLVLDAKGGENKAKAINGSATTWEFLIENSRVRTFWFVKILNVSFCQKLVSCGENGWLWEIGGVFESVINFSWNTFLYVSTSVFDLEIGNWVWFAKTNQVVANNDPNRPNLCFHLHWCCTSFSCFRCVGINHQKGGDWKGNVPLGHF
jgi:hypothetical protein